MGKSNAGVSYATEDGSKNFAAIKGTFAAAAHGWIYFIGRCIVQCLENGSSYVPFSQMVFGAETAGVQDQTDVA